MSEARMLTEAYPIQGGDFGSGGMGSTRLKERLKKIGVRPEILRRIMIAAYEAEMNVVIHARRGTMHTSIDNGRLCIQVKDEGPGIGDTDLAMKEGYSTASRTARRMGFGAGMGLPNIRQSADYFALQSRPGKGTVLDIVIGLAGQGAERTGGHSVNVVADGCTGCLKCVTACPTQAVRVRNTEPQVLDHLCIDCFACAAACRRGVFGVKGGPCGAPENHAPLAEDRISESRTPPESFPKARVLVIPAALLYQFGAGFPPETALKALGQLGFEEIRLLEGWEEALRRQVARYAAGENRRKPVIAPLCPAVVHLVALKYPCLIAHVAPLLSPLEAACCDLRSESTAYAISCPAQRSALLTVGGEGAAAIGVSALCSELGARLRGDTGPTYQLVRPDARDEEPARGAQGTVPGLQVFGIHSVEAVLEEAENGAMDDVPLLELYACPQGCFGTPLLGENPWLVRHRWETEGQILPRREKAVWCSQSLRPRTGMRLDDDMDRAIARLAEIEALAASLPGRDCAACGSPSCLAFAEDVVLGRADRTDCSFAGSRRGGKRPIAAEAAITEAR